jgi:hypothetical protein
MSEKVHVLRSEVHASSVKRAGFLGSIGLFRALRESEFLSPSQRLAKATEEIEATRPTLGDVAEGIETDMNHAAAVHAEHELPADSAGDTGEFNWVGDFPDKRVGFIDPDDPHSTYQGRGQ